MEADAGTASADNSVAAAELEAERAAAALENFSQKVRPLEVASTQLSLDQRKRRVKEAQQELNLMRSVRKSLQGRKFQPTVIELEAPTIEIGPGDGASFETEGEIAARGG